jgi:hypothetical protein
MSHISMLGRMTVPVGEERPRVPGKQKYWGGNEFDTLAVRAPRLYRA